MIKRLEKYDIISVTWILREEFLWIVSSISSIEEFFDMKKMETRRLYIYISPRKIL